MPPMCYKKLCSQNYIHCVVWHSSRWIVCCITHANGAIFRTWKERHENLKLSKGNALSIRRTRCFSTKSKKPTYCGTRAVIFEIESPLLFSFRSGHQFVVRIKLGRGRRCFDAGRAGARTRGQDGGHEGKTIAFCGWLVFVDICYYISMCLTWNIIVVARRLERFQAVGVESSIVTSLVVMPWEYGRRGKYKYARFLPR